MYKLIDAHMHFDLSASNPATDLVNQLMAADATGCVLILNSTEEVNVYKQNKALLDNYIICTSLLLDLQANGKREVPFTKLHPRLSGLTRDNYPQIMRIIQDCEARVITIDCFVYGHSLENDIGIELGIYLAQNLPDRYVVLAHAGGVRLLECLMQTKTLQNIYYDLSLTINYLWHSSIRQDMILLLMHHSNRVMFGSDYPSFSINEAKHCMSQLCEKAKLCNADGKNLFYENALKVYGL
ncbi:MAG: amidohydrolase family protein [Oscillospiraceae bacterium]|nr:amidohydrolase family protein [Oscillospiraceae bacterium]